LDDKYIYITYDESVIYKPCYKSIENRVFAIDLNPNYVGWSVVDWKSSSEFTVITTGVISTKDINDFDNNLKGLPTTDTKKHYINNKRRFEVYQITKYLVQIATHYRSELFITEDLSIESSDKTLGKRYNKLVNNQWNRSKMVENLKKRCNIVGIRFLTVQANYSSFIGNFLYRDLELPDMVLSSIELGRRGYEFSLQYIKKVKDKVKNIIFPLISDFKDRYIKSLEEFGISGEVDNLKDAYYKLKNAKSRYRVSLDDSNHLKFSRCFSNKSKIKKILIVIHKNT
jgi:IS605 OrfB family transposase